MTVDIRLEALREILNRLLLTPGAKAEKLHDAFVETIEIGLWRPGEQIPTEKKLLAALPVSQGTIQAAMRRLTMAGLVERKRGKGSRISPAHGRGSNAWFMRFRKSGELDLVPVSIVRASLTETGAQGTWSSAIGSRPSYVKLERVINIGGVFDVLAIAYLDAGRFRPLLDYSSEVMSYRHLRHLLHDRFHAPTLSTREFARFNTASLAIARGLEVAEGSQVLTLETTNLSLRGEAVVYQEFHIPPNELVLDLSRTAPSDA